MGSPRLHIEMDVGQPLRDGDTLEVASAHPLGQRREGGAYGGVPEAV
jgi:hypothetical protein